MTHLLVIGHTAHYERDGQIVGWGPTVKEVCWLAQAFDQVTHLACLHDGPAPESALPYDTDKVQFSFVPPAGGLTLGTKAEVLARAPQYVRAIRVSLSRADVVQVRCPGNLGMYGMLAASSWHGPKWAKYAANWVQSGRMPLSFRFQRYWLRSHAFGGPVTINGRWPGQRDHVHTFVNPSFTLAKVEAARQMVQSKGLEKPIRIVYVGRIVADKGLGIALEVVRCLLSGCTGAPRREFVFEVLGDGPDRGLLELQSKEMGLGNVVRFHGWVPHSHVCEVLQEAHFVLLPSRAPEGWPKVLSEAMAYGVVPLSSQVSAIPQVLAEVGSGVALASDDVPGYVRAIHDIVNGPNLWKQMVDAGLRAAPRFTYERYLIHLDEMLTATYGESCFSADLMTAMRAQWILAVARSSDTSGPNV